MTVHHRSRFPFAARVGAMTVEAGARSMPFAYRGRSGGTFKHIYDSDHAEARNSGRFRWMFSTCLAATVGAIAIFVVVYGSADRYDNEDGLMPALQRMRLGTLPPASRPILQGADGLKWSAPKTDRLLIAAGASSTRYVVHESLKQRRKGREYIVNKPYIRIVARLSAAPENYADVIPPFNPFKLYANSQPVTSTEESETAPLATSDVSVRVVELLGGILPGEDGQELDSLEVNEIVERAREADRNPIVPVALNSDATSGSETAKREAALPPNTTIFAKAALDADVPDEVEGLEVRVVTVGQGDTLAKILTTAGAEAWQARSMADATRGVFRQSELAEGLQVRITLVPSLTEQGKMEPAKFSVFSDGHDHLVTVSRNAAGEFVASATPMADNESGGGRFASGNRPQASTLYSSVYAAGLLQHLEPDTIMQVLRIHAYETDFRRRLRAGDSVEYFFDTKDETALDGAPGELLFTSITSGGENFKFYRYRSADGVVDFYDADGNNSKRFLTRRPVRGEDVRLTSGYGVRFHPLLNERRMHTGVDWACAPGTPILAAGNGTIEESGRKGQYGNYIRIRHANSYHTAYGHMSRFAPGVEPGVKVRQGQIIGYVGSTGLSSGPHLHFEVLVNTQFVDPLSIQVPRERKLVGKDLTDFQKERARIEDLMHRAPVMTNSK